jgi:hypothetical protein
MTVTWQHVSGFALFNYLFSTLFLCSIPLQLSDILFPLIHPLPLFKLPQTTLSPPIPAL